MLHYGYLRLLPAPPSPGPNVWKINWMSEISGEKAGADRHLTAAPAAAASSPAAEGVGGTGTGPGGLCPRLGFPPASGDPEPWGPSFPPRVTARVEPRDAGELRCVRPSSQG